jgi:hypothetical protein
MVPVNIATITSITCENKTSSLQMAKQDIAKKEKRKKKNLLEDALK